MKFVVSSALLSQRLQTIGRVIVPKSTLAVLENILFKVAGNELTLVAADGEITLTSTLELVDSEGEVTFMINAKTIQEAIREIPEQPVDIYVNEENYAVTVEYQNGKFNFVAQSADEYPVPPAMTEERVTFSMDSQLLYNGVNRSLFAASNDALRPQIGGLYFDVKENETAIVATDAQKMACTQYPAIGAGQVGSFILPKKPANLLKTALLKEEGAIRTQFDNKNAMFHLGDFVLVCRLIEGTYPKYNSVIPQNNPNIVVVDRTELLNGIKRVAVCSSQATNLIKLSISDNRINLVAQDRDYSMSATENLSCSYEGVPIVIGFKSTFLVEILSNTDTQCISIELGDHTRAGVFKPVYDADETPTSSILMLLMPMMLQEDDKA